MSLAPQVPASERAQVRVGLGNTSATEETQEQQLLLLVLLHGHLPFKKNVKVGAPLAALGSYPLAASCFFFEKNPPRESC